MDHPVTLTRREILAAGLAAAGAMSLGPRAFGADPPYGPFKMGIQSYSLRHYKLDEALAKTKELGLGFWESYSAHIPVVAEPARVDEFKAKAADHGVKVIGYGVIKFTKD